MGSVRLLALGTSAAWPIPRPGCRCPQCAEARRKPRLRRTRSGLLVTAGGSSLLVDAGPDVVSQLERLGEPPRIDRVLVTHTHDDHFLGLSDVVHLRTAKDEPLAVHAAPFHRRRIRAAFPSLFRKDRARVVLHGWGAGHGVQLGGRRGLVVVVGFETGHRSEFPTTGVRCLVERPGRPPVLVAYATDLGARLPAPTRELLRGVDLFVGDGTYPGTTGYGHPGSKAVLREARRLGARRIALTHVGHVGLREADLRRKVGSDVEILHDGDDLLALVPEEGQR